MFRSHRPLRSAAVANSGDHYTLLALALVTGQEALLTGMTLGLELAASICHREKLPWGGQVRWMELTFQHWLQWLPWGP